MTINKIRSWLYSAAKALGDVQAVERSAETGSAKPLLKRAERRILGRIAGRSIRSLTKW